MGNPPPLRAGLFISAFCDPSKVLLALSRHQPHLMWRYNSLCEFAGFNRDFPAPSSRVAATTRARVNNKVGLCAPSAFITGVNVTHCSEGHSKNTLPPYRYNRAVGVLLCFVDNSPSSFGSLPLAVVSAICFYHHVLPTHNTVSEPSNNRWSDQLIRFVTL